MTCTVIPNTVPLLATWLLAWLSTISLTHRIRSSIGARHAMFLRACCLLLLLLVIIVISSTSIEGAFIRYIFRPQSKPVKSHFTLGVVTSKRSSSCLGLCSETHWNCVGVHISQNKVCSFYGPDTESPKTITLNTSDGDSYINGKQYWRRLGLETGFSEMYHGKFNPRYMFILRVEVVSWP